MKYKSIFLVLLLVFSFVGCSEEYKVEKTATEHLKKQMKVPSSFKVEETEVLLRALPVYLNKKVLSCAQDLRDALKEQERYKNLNSYLWDKEKEDASRKVFIAIEALKDKCKDIEERTNKSDEKYIVLITYSASNSFGVSLQSRHIVIVDKDNTKEVLNDYAVDSDLANRAYFAYLACGNGYRNKDGEIETYGMGKIEHFIFGDIADK